MRADRVDAIEERLRLLESRVEAIDERLRRVEPYSPAQPAAPPKIEATPPPQPAYQWLAPPPVIPGARPVETPTPPSKQTRDTEYMIGAQLLPKLGAGLVLLGVLFFVAWGYSAGWITPSMVFSGEVLFCLAFIGVGQWKRNEKEQFGQILTGIGSCGLYLTLAAGHLVQNLYKGEVLVGLALALSYVNLLYGLGAKSRAFLGIGIIGGFGTALLPMQQDKATLSLILHFAILVPSVFIVVKRSWQTMAGWLFVASTLALLPMLVSSIDWQTRVSALYLSALLCAGAYAFTSKPNPFDQKSIGAAVMLFLTALMGIAIRDGQIAAVHLTLLAAGAAVVSLVAEKGSAVRGNLVLCGVAIVGTVAPFAFAAMEAAGILIGFSVLAATLTVFARLSKASAFAVIEFVLALGTYIAVQGGQQATATQETWLLLGLIAAACTSAYATVRNGAGAEPLTMTAMVVILPLFARLGVVTLTGSSLSPSPAVSIAEALVLFALAAIGLTVRTRWLSAMVAMWVSFAIAISAYSYAVAFGGVPKSHDAGLAFLLLLSAGLGAPAALLSAPTDFKKSISAVAGILVGLLAMRLAFVISTMPQVAASAPIAVVLTAALYSVGSSILAIVRKNGPAVAVGWGMFVAAWIAYLSMNSSAGELQALTGLFAAFVAASAATRPIATKQPQLWHVIALIGWVLVSQWLHLVFAWGGIDFRTFSTMTVAWIGYALVLITAGFWLKTRELRYWSFGVMFTTVSKILLIDLASTSIPFRVGVLLGLGLVMLGGGYWYVKSKGTAAPA